MTITRHILMLPGIGDFEWFYSFILPQWQRKDIVTVTHCMPWRFYEPYKVKLARLLKKIDQLYEQYGPLSLVGISASGSVGLEAFTQRKNKINRFVAITSWLSEKKKVFPPLDIISFNYPDFREAVLKAQEISKSLSLKDKKRILSVRGVWDGIIPLPTSEIDGVATLVTPTVTHTLNILYALTFARQQIQRFLLQDVSLPTWYRFAF